MFVFQTIRDDALGEMHANRAINDAQFMAGRTWQAKYLRGSKDILSASVTLGEVGAAVVHDILDNGRGIADVAAKHDCCRTRRDVAGWQSVFVTCLNLLANEFGLANTELAIS
jgi:hypothetical protein